MYPRSGFRSGGTSAKTTLLENHPFVNPRKMALCQAAGLAVLGQDSSPCRAFGQGVPDKAFHVEVPRCIPFEFCQQKGDVPGNMGQVPRANSFRHAPFPNTQSVRKRHFGKGILSRSSLGCALSVPEAKRNVPGNTRYVPPQTPFLKLLFRTPDLGAYGLSEKCIEY